MNAVESYLSMPSPDRAQHLWRYTPWHRIHPSGVPSELPDVVSPALVNLTYLDGSELPDGVKLSMATELSGSKHEDDVASTFIRAICGDETIKITVEDGINCEQPLLLSVESGEGICGLQVELNIGCRVECELITMIEGASDWFGLLRTGTISEGAIFNDTVVNRLGSSQFLRWERIDLSQNCEVRIGTVGSGGTRTKADLRYLLSGRGGNLKVNGSIFSAGGQHNDHHVEILHEAPDTFSRLNWHSSCGGKSRTIGTGMLRIANGAKGSDSAQVFNNLLLSREAEADSIPELEVLENEVVGCGHGTASGTVDDEQMFYLKTRGFSDIGAKGILIAAFLNTPLKEMGSNTMHSWLNRLLFENLFSEIIE